MRANCLSMLVAFGLAATATAEADDVEMPAPMYPDLELVIGSSEHPIDLRFARPRQHGSASDHEDDVTTPVPPDSRGLAPAFASPEILFGASHDFLTFSVHLGDGATTRVIFPGLTQ